MPSLLQARLDADLRKCPFCAELIKPEAVKCHHCGSSVEPLPTKGKLQVGALTNVFAILICLAVVYAVGWAFNQKPSNSTDTPTRSVPPKQAELPNNAAPAPMPPSSAVTASTSDEPNGKEGNTIALPSFDCSKARSRAEVTICGDSDLSRMDYELSILYKRARALASNKTSFDQVNSAEWKRRESTCFDKSCLLEWYGARQLQLSKTIQTSTQSQPEINNVGDITLLTEAQFNEQFRCPETYADDDQRKQELADTLRWYGSHYKEGTLTAYVSYRMQLLKAHHCDATLRNIASNSTTRETEGNAPVPHRDGPAGTDYTGADQIIRDECKREWSDDFSMRAHCERKQHAAVQSLALGNPGGISSDQFISVRKRCADEWPRDFSMRAYCENKQFNAIRELMR